MKLLPEEYWEWRTTIAEMHNANAEAQLAHAKIAIQGKDVEIAQLRLNAYKHVVKRVDENKKAYDSEYKRFKGKIEERLGISLDNKVIDDLTFEVKDINDGTS